MCNAYRSHLSADEIASAFSETRIPLRFDGVIPNLEPRDDIRITDTAPIVRRRPGGAAELVQLRWSWPGPGGKPVYNFRSEGRRFNSGRCLIPADAFYEFTTPEGSPRGAKKLKWVFWLAAEPWFCIAGLTRLYDGGEAFTMLTTEPGPDVAPIHNRQVVVLGRDAWLKWLDGPKAEDLLTSSPGGALTADAAGR